MGGRQSLQHVLISANKGVVSLFSLPIVSEHPRRREVLAFCAAFVLWPAEWPSGKPERAGGGAISSIECRSVSSTGVYFLFVCRMRDMDTSPWLDLLSHKLSFFPQLCFPPLLQNAITWRSTRSFLFVILPSDAVLWEKNTKLRLQCHFSGCEQSLQTICGKMTKKQ